MSNIFNIGRKNSNSSRTQDLTPEKTNSKPLSPRSQSPRSKSQKKTPQKLAIDLHKVKKVDFSTEDALFAPQTNREEEMQVVKNRRAPLQKNKSLKRQQARMNLTQGRYVASPMTSRRAKEQEKTDWQVGLIYGKTPSIPQFKKKQPIKQEEIHYNPRELTLTTLKHNFLLINDHDEEWQILENTLFGKSREEIENTPEYLVYTQEAAKNIFVDREERLGAVRAKIEALKAYQQVLEQIAPNMHERLLTLQELITYRSPEEIIRYCSSRAVIKGKLETSRPELTNYLDTLLDDFGTELDGRLSAELKPMRYLDNGIPVEMSWAATVGILVALKKHLDQSEILSDVEKAVIIQTYTSGYTITNDATVNTGGIGFSLAKTDLYDIFETLFEPMPEPAPFELHSTFVAPEEIVIVPEKTPPSSPKQTEELPSPRFNGGIQRSKSSTGKTITRLVVSPDKN